MPLRFLLDENQRRVLWHVIQRHNARGIDPIDAAPMASTRKCVAETHDAFHLGSLFIATNHVRAA